MEETEAEVTAANVAEVTAAAAAGVPALAAKAAEAESTEAAGAAGSAAVMAEVAVAVGWAMAAAPVACQLVYQAGKQGVAEEEVVAGLGSGGWVKAMVVVVKAKAAVVMVGEEMVGEVLGVAEAGRIESQM